MSYQNLEKIQPHIAAPRPGYAAPIAALNRLSPPDSAALKQGRAPPNQPPMYSSPSPTAPHPLNPPLTPITPAFARPPKAAGITFTDNKPIMRGNAEETLLPKRGEKGDDFWRRFSMVAKEEEARKPSSWLRKTQNGTTRLSRWVWVVGLLLIIVVAGAIGLGWYVSHNSPDHQQPKALGGTGTNRSGESEGKSSAAPTGTNTIVGAKVTPTFTVDRRELDPTPLPGLTGSDNHLGKRARTGFFRHRKGSKNTNHLLD